MTTSTRPPAAPRWACASGRRGNSGSRRRPDAPLPPPAGPGGRPPRRPSRSAPRARPAVTVAPRSKPHWSSTPQGGGLLWEVRLSRACETRPARELPGTPLPSPTRGDPPSRRCSRDRARAGQARRRGLPPVAFPAVHLRGRGGAARLLDDPSSGAGSSRPAAGAGRVPPTPRGCAADPAAAWRGIPRDLRRSGAAAAGALVALFAPARAARPRKSCRRGRPC